MDIWIKISDENGDVLREFNVYKDGSDSEGSDDIAKFLKNQFGMDNVTESDYVEKPANDLETTENLDFNQTKIDLINSLLEATPNRLARLASMVLTGDPVAVDGSATYYHGCRV